LIANQSDMQLIGEASNGREALEQFRKHHPDITLIRGDRSNWNSFGNRKALRITSAPNETDLGPPNLIGCDRV
jgi:chemotaxis response regulator CheB